MRKILILLPLFITCHLFQGNKTPIKENEEDIDETEYETDLTHTHTQNPKPIKRERIHSKHRLFELFEDHLNNICLQPPHFPQKCKVQICGITWIKIKSKTIVRRDKTPIPELKNKLKYSYAIAPIKYNDGYNANITPLILIEIFDSNIEVVSFKLTNHPGLELDLSKKTYDPNAISIIQTFYDEVRNSILRAAKYKIKSYGGEDVHLYGILNMPTISQPRVTGNVQLISIFADLFKNKQWESLQAEITIKDKTTNQEKTYQILLSSKVFNEFIKTTLLRHKGITNVHPTFQAPVKNE
ncbi:hypothetical protein [Borrelia hermsii]|uniref:BB0158 famile outer surface lipoprotein n=1 Tax=Borrelia hermsii TaxID=140 RepID=UPI00046D6A9F|nr:hypothetical protein [Borrelia hermsii]